MAGSRDCKQSFPPVLEAWRSFLLAFGWTWFGTLTLRRVLCRSKAWTKVQIFISEIHGIAGSPLGWFVVAGNGELHDRLHFHFLVAGAPQWVASECEKLWFRLAGNAQIRQYDPKLGATHYCAKHLATREPEYLISGDLESFRLLAVAKGDAPIMDEPITTRLSTGWNVSERQEMKTLPESTQSHFLAHDKQLREQWSKTKAATQIARRELIRFGQLCDHARAMELHKQVRRPGSKSGYITFEAYICDVTGGEISKSNIYNSISLHRLTEGEHALRIDDVVEMPVQNACLLGRLKPDQRTADLVAIAKSASKREFPARLQTKLNETLPPALQIVPRVDFFRKLHPVVATKLEETIERFTRLPIVRDGDKELTLQEKAIYAICNAAEQFAFEELASEERPARH